MSKTTNSFTKLLVAGLLLPLLLASCCDGDAPNSVAIAIAVVNKEDFNRHDPNDCNDIRNYLNDIVVTLRNDTISDEILKEKMGSSARLGFVFSSSMEYKDRDEYKDWIFVTDDVARTIGGESDYYCIVNDPESTKYDANYETREVHWTEDDRWKDEENTDSAYKYIYLPRKQR